MKIRFRAIRWWPKKGTIRSRPWNMGAYPNAPHLRRKTVLWFPRGILESLMRLGPCIEPHGAYGAFHLLRASNRFIHALMWCLNILQAICSSQTNRENTLQNPSCLFSRGRGHVVIFAEHEWLAFSGAGNQTTTTFDRVYFKKKVSWQPFLALHIVVYRSARTGLVNSVSQSKTWVCLEMVSIVASYGYSHFFY